MRFTVVLDDFLEQQNDCAIISIHGLHQWDFLLEVEVPKFIEDILIENLSLLNSSKVTKNELRILWRSFFWQMLSTSIFFFSILAFIRSALVCRTCYSSCYRFYFDVVTLLNRLFIAVIIVDQFIE